MDGIHRRVDELGRIVLPVEMRRSLGIAERDLVEVRLEGESILLRKSSKSCVFCGSERGLLPYRGKYLCMTCLQTVWKENGK